MSDVVQVQSAVQSAVRLAEKSDVVLQVAVQNPPPKIIVVDDDGVKQPDPLLPDELPDWAMPLDVHSTTVQKTATYRCVSCGGEHEEYRTNTRDLPYAKVCGCLTETKLDDGSIEKCTAVALRRTTYPGEGVALNARRFEPMAIYERANYDSLPDDAKRSLNRYYVPGRNNEPDEPGMKRIEITNINEYNKVVKRINAYETQKMRDHRAMHQEYWKARRSAMRDDVNARIRHSPLLRSLARLVRARSDRKSDVRYGKSLDAHFHGQLIEFDQGKIQAWTDKDNGWKDRRAK